MEPEQEQITRNTQLRCDTCGEKIPWGKGSMDKADQHERDNPDHWVQNVPHRR